MITADVDLVTVSEILGHSDIKMTCAMSSDVRNRRKAVNVLCAVFIKKSGEGNIKQATDRRDLTHSLTSN